MWNEKQVILRMKELVEIVEEGIQGGGRGGGRGGKIWRI